MARALHRLLPAGERGRGPPAGARPPRERGARRRCHRTGRRPPWSSTEVLTAHPTEAKRRAVVEHLLAHRRHCSTRSTTRAARAASARTCIGGWPRTWRRSGSRTRSAATRRRRSTRCGPRSPCSTGRSSRRCRRCCASTGEARACDGPPGSAGDRDGNPRVTAAVTTEAVSDRPRARPARLRGRGAPDRPRALGERGRRARLGGAPTLAGARRRRVPDARAGELARTLPDAPHRRKLVLVGRATGRDARGPRRRVRRARGAFQRGPGGAPRRRCVPAARSALADGDLAHLDWQVEAFGFHLASMEIRQHARASCAPRSPDPTRRWTRRSRRSPRSRRRSARRRATG